MTITGIVRWLVIPPFVGVLRTAQWAAYSAWRAWMDHEDPAPPLPPFSDEDRAWLREQHRLATRPW